MKLAFFLNKFDLKKKKREKECSFLQAGERVTPRIRVTSQNTHALSFYRFAQFAPFLSSFFSTQVNFSIR